MHKTAVLDTMKKHGHFNDYNKVYKAHKEAAKAAESAEAGLALLEGTSKKISECRLKKLEKAKKATKEALEKAQETKPVPREAVATAVAPDSMRAGFQADLLSWKCWQHVGNISRRRVNRATLCAVVLCVRLLHLWRERVL